MMCKLDIKTKRHCIYKVAKPLEEIYVCLLSLYEMYDGKKLTNKNCGKLVNNKCK